MSFRTTNWSVILAAANQESPHWKAAIGELCQRYWYPLYAFTRQRGYSDQEAEDLIQGFFAEVLEKHYLHSAEPRKGRFRTFLLVCLKRYLTGESRYRNAQKRGGGRIGFSFDTVQARNRYGGECADNETPDRLFERRWALSLIEHALAELRTEMQREGHGMLYSQLRAFLVPESGRVSQREVAERVGMTEGALRVALHRMRRRFRELLRTEIARTVASADDVNDEVAEILRILSS